MRKHVEDQINEITGKYFSESLDAQVTFSREAHLFRADITVHAGRGIVLQANASAAEPYPCLSICRWPSVSRAVSAAIKIKSNTTIKKVYGTRMP